MKNNLKKTIAVFASIAVTISLFTFILYGDENTYEVASGDEFRDAVTNILAAESGSYVIELTDDIELSSFSVDKPVEITIIGNGHEISNLSTIYISGGATVDLGSSNDDTNTLTIRGVTNNDEPGMIYIWDDDATCNMYGGVTLTGHVGENYLGGGVTVSGGTFNMYGGTISECGINGGSVCYGGGVSIVNGGTFNMSGGGIEDCYVHTSLPGRNKGILPWGAGGGVFVGDGSVFNMSGGEITGCSATESGGGVFIVNSIDSYYDHMDYGYLDSVLNMTGGTISGCSADYYGGGVCVSGYYIYAPTIGSSSQGTGNPAGPGVYLSGGKISGNTATAGGGLFAFAIDSSISFDISNNISNNTASDEASDILLDNVFPTNVGNIADAQEIYMGDPSDITGQVIDGYYADGYLNGESVDRFVDLDPDDRVLIPSSDIQGTVSLIAAVQTPKITITFETSGIGNTVDPQIIVVNGYVIQPGGEEWEVGYQVTGSDGKTYEFTGWFEDAECTTEFDFSSPVSSDTTIYAGWKEVIQDTPTPAETDPTTETTEPTETEPSTQTEATTETTAPSEETTVTTETEATTTTTTAADPAATNTPTPSPTPADKEASPVVSTGDSINTAALIGGTALIAGSMICACFYRKRDEKD